ncbi:hypothetical protein BDV96DRAFT_605286 [Lophiotrema nucula]|uniref:Uncharacterized protein n=1 Tax=Lophiotrema nucula TaxID=690887 RepID=A0A6A5YPD3_9PLEO|nr:hypothetical protein BDV96DRAFT_605286 [Lophiotrema nucula]
MADNPSVVIVTAYTTVPAQEAVSTANPSSISSAVRSSMESSLASSIHSSISSSISSAIRSSLAATSTAHATSSSLPTGFPAPDDHAAKKDPPATTNPIAFLYLVVSLLVLAFIIYGIIFIIMMFRGRCSNCASVEASNRKLLSGDQPISREQFQASETRRHEMEEKGEGDGTEHIGIWPSILGPFAKFTKAGRQQHDRAQQNISARASSSHTGFDEEKTLGGSNNSYSNKDYGLSRETLAKINTHFPRYSAAATSTYSQTRLSHSATAPRPLEVVLDHPATAATHYPPRDSRDSYNNRNGTISPSLYSQYNSTTNSLPQPNTNTYSFTNHLPELEHIPPTDPDYQTYLNAKQMADNPSHPDRVVAQAHANQHLRAMRKRWPEQRPVRVGGYGGFENNGVDEAGGDGSSAGFEDVYLGNGGGDAGDGEGKKAAGKGWIPTRGVEEIFGRRK